MKLTYDIKEALLPMDERPYYVRVSVSDEDGNAIEIITNKELRGRFVQYENPYRYEQIAGTVKFALPSSATGLRTFLRKKYLEHYGD